MEYMDQKWEMGDLTLGSTGELIDVVGLKATNQDGYNSKFGIVFNKHSAIPIAPGAARLVADESGLTKVAAIEPELVHDLKNDFETQDSELDMFFITLPNVEPLALNEIIPVVAKKSDANHLRTDGICAFKWANTEAVNRSAMYMAYADYMLDFLPQDFVENKIKTKGISSVNLKWLREWDNSLVIKVTVPPKHGDMLIDDRMDEAHPSYSPHKGYVGKDRVEVLVSGKDLEGRSISKKLVYFINVLPEKEMDAVVKKYSAAVKKYCGTADPVWRISSGTNIFNATNDLAAWQSSLPHRSWSKAVLG